jgi:hypothetical protein
MSDGNNLGAARVVNDTGSSSYVRPYVSLGWDITFS